MANSSPIRVGRIGTVNTETGMVPVVYEDRGGASTAEIPVLCPGGIWRTPQIGSLVLVTVLSNGSSMGIVLGEFTNSMNKPVQGADWSLIFGADTSKYMSFSGGKLQINCDVEIKGNLSGSGNASFDGQVSGSNI